MTDEAEYQRQLKIVSTWLAEQHEMTLMHQGESLNLPEEVARVFVAYTARAQKIMGSEKQGKSLGWEATKWIMQEPWGKGFRRPEFVKWLYLFITDDLVEAEKYFWTAVVEAAEMSNWSLLSYERVGELSMVYIRKLRSAEMEALDEWGLDRPSGGA